MVAVRTADPRGPAGWSPRSGCRRVEDPPELAAEVRAAARAALDRYAD